MYMVGYSGNWDILGVLKYHIACILIIRVYVCVTIIYFLLFITGVRVYLWLHPNGWPDTRAV